MVTLKEMRQSTFWPLPDAKMEDLEEREHDRWGHAYTFHIRGSRTGFHDGKEAVKDLFKSGEEREYDPETHLWWVPATPESRDKLEAIFGNAANVFTTREAQLPMWDDDEYDEEDL